MLIAMTWKMVAKLRSLVIVALCLAVLPAGAANVWVDRESALGTALISGDLENVRLGIQAGADPNARMKAADDPAYKGLHALPLVAVAIIKDHDDVVRYLLQQGADPNGRLSPGSDLSVLWLSMCRLRSYRSALILIDFGAKIGEAVDHCSGNVLEMIVKVISVAKLKAGHEADEVREARSNAMPLLKKLLTTGLDPDYRSAEDGVETPLVGAVSFSEREVIDVLLEYGAGVNTRSGLDGITPLHAAFVPLDRQPVDTEIIGKLLDAGADPRLDPEPAFIAEVLFKVDAKTARRLFEHNLDPNIGAGFHNAILHGDADIVREFIRAGVNVNNYRAPHSDSAPLATAVRGKDWAIVDLLIDAGADIDVEFLSGITVRQKLISEGQLQFSEPGSESNIP